MGIRYALSQHRASFICEQVGAKCPEWLILLPLWDPAHRQQGRFAGAILPDSSAL